MSIIQWLLSVIPWILLVIITATIVITLLCKYPAWDSKKKDSNGRPNKPRHEKWFYAWIIGIAVLGGTWAFFLPIAINSGFGKDDDGAALRQALIYTTGGILGVITLGETHRKNTLEKTKNDQDHTRQVHAERRSRYTTAVEQLSSDKASIRLGGVYTLVGLADEWLADENFEERHKEGQVIINNLCAYIRSPFDLASKHKELSKEHQVPENYEGGTEQFSEDQGRFREEQDIRLGIMQEMRDRLRNRLHSLENDSGPWSNFDYNFVNATFFYDIDLSGVRFTSEANFTDAVFNKSAEFTESKFTGGANFCKTRFIQDANFKFAIFMTNIAYRNVSFTQAIFKKDAIFKYATFFSKADFTKSTFTKKANFIGAIFDKSIFLPGGASFTEAHFIQAPRFEGHPSNELPSTRFVQGSKNDFRVSEDSSFIETEKHRSPNGTITIIPKGCIIFDSEQPS